MTTHQTETAEGMTPTAQSRVEPRAERLERLPRVLEAYAKDIDKYGKPMDSGLAPVLCFAAEIVRELSTANAARRDAEAKVEEMRTILIEADAMIELAESYGHDCGLEVGETCDKRKLDEFKTRLQVAISTTIPGKSRVAELEQEVERAASLMQRALGEIKELRSAAALWEKRYDEQTLTAATALKQRDTALARVEWLWKNCRIIYFPEGINAYPIEHQPFCDKYGRKFIEPIMGQALAPPKAASVEAEKGMCLTCAGSGLIGGVVGQTAEQYDERSEPCPDCEPEKASAAGEGGVKALLELHKAAMLRRRAALDIADREDLELARIEARIADAPVERTATAPEGEVRA